MQVIFICSPVGQYFPTQQASNFAVGVALDAAWCPLFYLSSVILPGDSIGSPRSRAQPHSTNPAPLTCQLPVLLTVCKPEFPRHHPQVHFMCQNSSENSEIERVYPSVMKYVTDCVKDGTEESDRKRGRGRGEAELPCPSGSTTLRESPSSQLLRPTWNSVLWIPMEASLLSAPLMQWKKLQPFDSWLAPQFANSGALAPTDFGIQKRILCP